MACVSNSKSNRKDCFEIIEIKFAKNFDNILLIFDKKFPSNFRRFLISFRSAPISIPIFPRIMFFFDHIK